jgi:signal transduction histidine kinase
MALAGADSIRTLHQIETLNAGIAQRYLTRQHCLEQIRSALYLSSTFVRDYLLETNPERAQAGLSRLRSLRAQMNAGLQDYSRSLGPGDSGLASDLGQDLSAYWAGLEPILKWGAAERRSRGYRFLQAEVLPRRELVLQIADRIDRANEQGLDAKLTRSANLFADFRRRVMATLALTLGLGLVVAAISIGHTLKLENEARCRYQEITRAREELHELSARLVEAQEQERRSISRELHDEVGQSLSALLMDAANLSAITPPENEQARRLIASIREFGEQTMGVVRNMALLLRPSMLDDFGLLPALHWQAREVSRRTGIRVRIEAAEVAELPEEHKTCIYRIVQEALRNASRHADAKNATVTVRRLARRIVLTIKDDGRGFDAQRVRGFGLVGMKERVAHLGGRFEVLSQPAVGTLLTAELPLPPESLKIAV